MGRKMRNPPIFYTIAQVQFSPFLQMTKIVSDIQASLRKKYPDFRQDKMANFILQFGPQGPIQQQGGDRWHFIDAKNSSGFILRNEALVFHTTAYETSEVLFECVLEGIGAVNKYAELGFVESVAIRTLDAVVPEGGTALRKYLKPAVRGFSEEFDGQLKQSVVESTWDIPPNGVLISRSAIVQGGLGVPMDLFPLSLELKPSIRTLNVQHAVLDNDRQEKGRFDYNLDQIHERLVTVKKGASLAFSKAVTPFALEQWQ
jgi:uncharacterized protein (TIGR04255 family)